MSDRWIPGTRVQPNWLEERIRAGEPLLEVLDDHGLRLSYRAHGAPLQRFWSQVSCPSACWEWQAGRTPEGYGKIKIEGHTLLAHRVAYEQARGPIPDGLTLDHLCRNRACVNPAHLEPVTHAENILRGESPSALNARKTHCANGHPYDDANTQLDVRGRRCRECHRQTQLRYRARKKARKAAANGL